MQREGAAGGSVRAGAVEGGPGAAGVKVFPFLVVPAVSSALRTFERPAREIQVVPRFLIALKYFSTNEKCFGAFFVGRRELQHERTPESV